MTTVVTIFALTCVLSAILIEVRSFRRRKILRRKSTLIDNSSECIKARQMVSEAIATADNFPRISRSVVRRQVQLFPHAFTTEECKYLVDWANNS